MPDDRPLQEKLVAMAEQSASPEEAKIARAFLRKRRPAGVLSREFILGTPDRSDLQGGQVSIRMPSGVWLVMARDEVDWDMVREYHLRVKR